MPFFSLWIRFEDDGIYQLPHFSYNGAIDSVTPVSDLMKALNISVWLMFKMFSKNYLPLGN